MNPSPVIRSRSRSPSPVSHRRECSDSEVDCSLKSKLHRTNFTDDHVQFKGRAGSGDSDGGHSVSHTFRQFLTVPGASCESDLPKTKKRSRRRSLSDSSRRTTRKSRREMRPMVIEPRVEIVNGNLSINNDDAPPASASYPELTRLDLNDPRTDADNDNGNGNDNSNPNPYQIIADDADDNCRDGEPSRLEVTSTGVEGRRRRRRWWFGRGTGEDKKRRWTEEQVEQLRRRVKFFFMDPWNKFKARRDIPWKMLIQFVKIIIITVQLVDFGRQRSDVVEYFEHNQKTLKHLLLKDWDTGFETMPYPPATGTYALYSVDQLLDAVQFTWSQYHNLSSMSLAVVDPQRDSNDTILPIRLCTSLNNYRAFHNGTFIVRPGIVHNCTHLVPLEGKNPYDIRAFFKETNITIPFTKLTELTLDFSFNTFHLNLIETHHGPICYKVDSTIRFQNYERSGQVLINLESAITQRVCSGKIMSPGAAEDEERMKTNALGLDGSVIATCILSILLCLRSLFRSWRLKRLTEEMFRERFGKKLELKDRLEFISFWYFLIIINDIFTIIGSSIKIQLETRVVPISSYTYDACSLMLGLGGLLAWIGVLRYLAFFKKYNILIVTLKTAFPNVVRFLLCALAMYCGFLFCGWVILGPYHIKFRHLSTASECLFSLVNGDDMFVTFSATESNNLMVWYFSRIYLYTFISLFIYCVLSLFIAVIMDTYETIKGYGKEGPPPTELWSFVNQCNHPVHSGLYRRQHTEDRSWTLVSVFTDLFRRRKAKEEVEERRPLLTQTI
ncbi:mucolipin-3-like [Babylonia areolata]|uniref:mucolipin-3-like n=1 Tax=Babylonia areolata TaxID=304850 RepID=UPI003FD02BB3